jgi:hypothetical protein
VKSPKNYLILLLLATTVGGAVFAWRQYAELVELRAAAMNRDERADLQKRLWELEKLNRELQGLIAAKGESNETDGAAGAVAATSRNRRPRCASW